MLKLMIRRGIGAPRIATGGLVLGGAVAYSVYSLVLYAFAVHFNS